MTKMLLVAILVRDLHECTIQDDWWSCSAGEDRVSPSVQKHRAYSLMFCRRFDGICRWYKEISWRYFESFDELDKMTGLKISMEKSTFFVAGVVVQKQGEIPNHFPFASWKLPVCYLGLLLTKNMTVLDYLPLIEKIRKRIDSWTSRFLSYAGRLQLIKSVITSLTNFWIAAFRLPNGCIKEIERMCAAFLCVQLFYGLVQS